MNSPSPQPKPNDSPFVGTPAPKRALPKPPGPVYAAGIIWCVIAAIGLFGALVLTSLGGLGGAIAATVPALISLTFLYVGVKTVRGDTPDTLGNGVGSIAIGLLGVVAIILSWVEGLAAISCGLQSLALLVAGWLALSARGDYKRWRDRHG